MVYFCQAGVLLSLKNATLWPILASLGYYVAYLRTFWCTFNRHKQCGGVPKLTNIRYGQMLQKWQLEKHSQMKTGTSPSPMRLESMIQAALAQDTSFPLTWPSWLHPGLLCSEKELSGTSSVKSHLHWGCLLLPQVGASWNEDLWDLGVKLPPRRFMFQKRYHLEPWSHTYSVVRASQATIAGRLKQRRGHYFKVSSSFHLPLGKSPDKMLHSGFNATLFSSIFLFRNPSWQVSLKLWKSPTLMRVNGLSMSLTVSQRRRRFSK